MSALPSGGLPSGALPAAPARSNERLKGVLYLLSGGGVFLFQDLVIKTISGRFPLPEALAIRCLVAYLALAVLIHYDGGFRGIRTKQLRLQLLRAVLLFASYTFYYLSLAALPLAEAVAINFSAPLIIVALSGPILKERAGWRRWMAVAIGFAGVLVMLRPGLGLFEIAAILPVGAAATYAVAQILARHLAASERASIMSFYQNSANLAGALLLGLAFGSGAFAESGHPSLQFLLRGWSMPHGIELLMIASTGLVAAIGSWCLTNAYRLAEVNVVAPFEYCSIVWAVLAGYLVWGEVPDHYTILGILFVVGAGIYVLRFGR
jgi:drug/metabolite transporter (DMT)-like permease